MLQSTQTNQTGDQLARKQNLKKLVKIEGTIWGLTIVGANLFILAAQIIVEVIFAFLPKLSALSDTAFGQLIEQIVYSTLMFTIPFLIVALLFGKKLSSLISVKWVRVGLSAPLIMASLGAAMVMNLLVSQFTSVLNSFNLVPESPDMPLPDGVFGIILYIFTISVVPAIVEEFAFRGIILGAMKPYGSAVAILASSLLFGLMHGNFVQIPFAAMLGCALGYLTVVTGSIIPACIVHALNNLIGAVQMVIMQKCDQATYNIVSYGLFLFYLLIGIVGVALICKTHKHPFAPIRERSALTVGQAFKAVCSSAGFIVSYIFFGGTACLYLLVTSITSA